MERYKQTDKQFKISLARVISFEGNSIFYSYSYADGLKEANIVKPIDLENIKFERKALESHVSEAKQKDVEILLKKNGVDINEEVKDFYHIQLRIIFSLINNVILLSLNFISSICYYLNYKGFEYNNNYLVLLLYHNNGF